MSQAQKGKYVYFCWLKSTKVVKSIVVSDSGIIVTMGQEEGKGKLMSIDITCQLSKINAFKELV